LKPGAHAPHGSPETIAKKNFDGKGISYHALSKFVAMRRPTRYFGALVFLESEHIMLGTAEKRRRPAIII
jgi:hypothetical protein